MKYFIQTNSFIRAMSYARHPYFDDSGSAWLEFALTEDGTPAESGGNSPPCDIVRRDFDEITSLVLHRLKTSIPIEWMTECPYPYLNQLLVHPMDGGGVRVFLQYMFLPSLIENSPHSDSWWAIAHCPYPDGNPYTNKVEYTILHFGWAIDWQD